MARARAAVPSEDEAVTELIRAVSQLLRRLRAETNSSQLSLSQSGAMARLDENGWMTTADLARAERVKPQSMGATLAALEDDGLVQRRPDPSDGRQVLFGLTEQGRTTRQRASAAKRAWLTDAMAKLTPEERQTLVSAISLLKRLSAP